MVVEKAVNDEVYDGGQRVALTARKKAEVLYRRRRLGNSLVYGLGCSALREQILQSTEH